MRELQSIVESLGRDLVTVAMAAGTFLVAYIAGYRVFAGRGVWHRWVATITLHLWVLPALFHLLAFLDLFATVPAVAAIGAMAVAAYALGGRGDALSAALARDAEYLGRAASRLLRSPHRWFVLAFVLFATPRLLHALLLPPLAWDTLTYHAVKPAMWVQYQGVDRMSGPGPWAYYRDMPGGSEVFWAWAMLPQQADTFAPAVDLIEWLALGVAIIALARAIGVREPFGTTAAGFVLALPTIGQLAGSGYVEDGQLLAVICGIVCALAGRRHDDARWMVAAAAALVDRIG